MSGCEDNERRREENGTNEDGYSEVGAHAGRWSIEECEKSERKREIATSSQLATTAVKNRIPVKRKLEAVLCTDNATNSERTTSAKQG